MGQGWPAGLHQIGAAKHGLPETCPHAAHQPTLLPPCCSPAGRLRSLALGLPHLADLQLNNCVELGQLVLHCPALERMSMQVGGG